MDLRIAPLSSRDHAAVTTLVAEMGISSAFNWPPEALEPELRWAEGWGLWRGDRLAAFVLWRMAFERNEITCLATHPDFRRRGEMKLLLRALAHQFNDAAWLLEVHEDNEAAQALYISLGFERVGRRRRYYRDQKDALVYRRPPLVDKPLP